MPRKKRLKIEERMLSEIADSIITLLINESEDSLEKIKHAVKQAGRIYTGEEYNWLFSSILTYWRSRKSEAKNTERDIYHYTDVLTRLKTFSNVFLNPDGAWESTSYNTLLIVHLLGAIDDESNPCEKTFYYHIAAKLAVPFKLKLQEWIHQYEYQQKITEEKVRSLKTLADKNFEATLGAVLLFSDKEQAHQSAIKNPKQVVFRLHHKDEQWKLTWYDLMGEKNVLDVSDELKTLLAKANPSDSVYLKIKEVKSECLKLRDNLIEKRQVLINPPPSEMTELRKVFILKITKEDYALQWYDVDGVCRLIDLSQYPDFVKLLDSVDDIDDYTKLQIERHLCRVNVLTKNEINGHIKKLDTFFKLKSAEAIPTFEVLIDPQSHQLAGLESTFVLYLKAETIQLEWYDAFGKGHEINTKASSELTDWIKAHENVEKDDLPELKRLLAQIDTSKAMDRSEFKAQLKACLEKNFKKAPDPLLCLPEKKESVKPGKLNLSEFPIAGLFGHRGKPAIVSESEEIQEKSGLDM